MDEHHPAAADSHTKSIANRHRNINIFAVAGSIDISVGVAIGNVCVSASQRIAKIIYI